ncbi:hypothetical protein [Lyngbya aestuarii]|uniref:hypothetical protein n=1 Tax=Lyngbya aestuarii TaxID=118322 RepID=UPI00403E0DB3
MSHLPPQVPPFGLPEDIPETLPKQQFQLGDSVRWRQVPNPDFGCILGVIYTHSASCLITGLHYLVLLDKQSPSSQITRYDFAFEEDIEHLNQPFSS